jgi:hypothetical protein
MQTPPEQLSDHRCDQAIRTKIGDVLRTLFVPTEPPPERLLELPHALDQPKGVETSGTEERPDAAKHFSDILRLIEVSVEIA